MIGTAGTIKSGIYGDTIRQFKPDAEVFGKACPLFVPLVEEGLWHDSVTEEIASRYVSELKGKFIDTLVMGCTHYPLIRGTLRKIMGENVTLVNPAYETAIELKNMLREQGLTCEKTPKEKYQFFVSDQAEEFTSFAKSILPEVVKETKKIAIEEF